MAESYYSNVDRLKIGHSLSMDGHSPVPVDMFRPRSSNVLASRGPSLPALSLDLSADFTNENIERRRLHSAVLEENPNVFKRKHKDESASATIHNLEKVKDLLAGMHELRDFRDINKSRSYTRSRLLKERTKEAQELEQYHYDNMHPIEDFVRPYDLESRRSTGYEYGHIRSLLKLDTFGPANSASILKRRAQGELPASPNLDRHNLVSPEHELKPAVLIPNVSCNSSRASSADDSYNYRGAFPSLQPLRRDAERMGRASSPLAANPSRHVERNDQRMDSAEFYMRKNSDILVIHPDGESQNSEDISSNHTSFAGPALTPSKSIRSSSRPGTSASRAESRGSVRFPDATFPGMAITENERILKDPYLRRKAWFQSYTRRVEYDQSRKETNIKKKKYREEQNSMAREERSKIDDFENHLILAKFQ